MLTHRTARGASTHRRHARGRGMVLVELLVALTLLGIVLAMVSAISLREQQFLRNVDASAASSARLREARAVLPLDLRGLAPEDVRVSEARDTSIEVRANIASAVVCDTAGGNVILAAKARDSLTYTSMVRDPERGDTAWVLDATGDSARWSPVAIDTAFVLAAGPCAPSIADLATAGGPRWSLRPRPDSARVAIAPGTALRVTRPIRYTTYRASDGEWYLGAREWNPSLGRFDAVQPVAGPLAPGGTGLRVRYFDSAGVELAPLSLDVKRVVLIQLSVHALTREARVHRANLSQLRLSDSGRFSVRLRNAR